MIKPQVKSAIRLWFREGLNVLDKFEKKKWNLSFKDLMDFLNETFSTYKIKFILAENPDKDNTRKYIESGLFYPDGIIEILLKYDLLPFLLKLRSKKDYMVRWMDFNRNRFLEEYVEVMSHELLHRKQWELGMMNDDKSSAIPVTKEYLSCYSEIQTHAQDAALNLLHNRSATGQIYFIGRYQDHFNNDDPVFKRFLKNLHGFLEMMKEDQSAPLF